MIFPNDEFGILMSFVLNSIPLCSQKNISITEGKTPYLGTSHFIKYQKKKLDK